ncbi:calcineurin-like phosphoesterase C-terminal domain-containing protein [Methyloraptor flagellatus]|uniref:Calcineurin-like phosphoesterase C-terminal domain-containing protein n=1 Tax=Methyloraptor flagellatus TaxID=3162530 RepID=A0AAU7X5X0_9HYPH
MVNLFDGGPKSAIEVAFGKGGFAPMKKVERKDPFVVELYARNEATKKPWVKPANASHLWELPLPRNLPAGTHRVTVRATDEYGRTAVDSMVLEVLG